LEFITSYKALDEYTLEIKIAEVYAPALGQMSGLISPLPQHIWEQYDWSDPETNPEINSPTVVSGPYKLLEWQRDQYTIFEANENYWYHGRPNIDISLTKSLKPAKATPARSPRPTWKKLASSIISPFMNGGRRRRSGSMLASICAKGLSPAILTFAMA
jgi:ABC-type transport system substrate-binding protein